MEPGEVRVRDVSSGMSMTFRGPAGTYSSFSVNCSVTAEVNGTEGDAVLAKERLDTLVEVLFRDRYPKALEEFRQLLHEHEKQI